MPPTERARLLQFHFRHTTLLRSWRYVRCELHLPLPVFTFTAIFVLLPRRLHKSNFDDPLCRRDCNDRGTLLVGADVVYDEGDGDGVWSCCGRTTDGTNGVDCSNPVDRLSFQIGWTPDQFPGPVDKALTPGVTTTVGSVTGAMTRKSSAATSMPTAQTSQNSLMSTTVVGSATATAAVSPQSPTAAATDHNTGLSTGAKAGIGVGTAVVALALLGMIAAILLLWKKQSKPDQNRTSAPSTETPQKPEGGYDFKPSVFHRSQGFASHPHELSASAMTHELDSSVQPRHMMDSGFRTHQE
ncbi:hypothetical protein M409DRAFT_53560 [Zasmidium cellare ATCC 36951]|uniref:Uncharacterized protein n=1 Tax=Zasmidium cellare ATCC 36951 TaxID=1080233 RepID=A0A6A6CS15_ZASCE|nr:uncharacterized protein M409DRAFT_53560 [Zasmidium cellare ATCC 36951]KAF2168276.1 hypothetical protein M409DRAFT_53560 [Zasmidium cellare ATCC 36951]